MAQFTYNNLKVLVGEGFDWVGDDVRLLLLDAAGAYVPNPDHLFVATLDPVTTELDTDNYVRKVIAGKAVVRNDAADRAQWTADPLVFADLGPGAGGPTIQAGVLYLHVTNDADSPLLAYLDAITGPVNGLDMTIAFDATGIVRPSAA